jgi:hypothetical protein
MNTFSVPRSAFARELRAERGYKLPALRSPPEADTADPWRRDLRSWRIPGKRAFQTMGRAWAARGIYGGFDIRNGGGEQGEGREKERRVISAPRDV